MNPTLPGHIPTGLVREFDHHRDPAISVDPFAAMLRTPDPVGAGPHRCLGARIATRALATALREWHRRIPAYSIPGHAVLRTGGGTVCSLTALPLTWSASPKGTDRVGQMRPSGR